ncbi:helix-turn-helix domain-containing protein [Streptomyces sp. RFCAC02]|uniref:helix-turn-helix domain-containing protein n=1 Tax=Streptomyces sp. RFCAC02 TaxID=2499143 RepID=UPI001021EE17|nr:helix-turn-helix domain-containing protein [Streptomyces sp. RFCAC02]
MSRWKDLPATLDPALARLVVRLREHKDRSGLSIAALAARTGYGRSSWDRYLNGRALPPDGAVEALARVCDADAAPLLVLRELAAGHEPVEEPADEAPAPPRPAVPWTAILLSNVATALVTLAVLMLVAPWEHGAAQVADEKPYTGPVHPELGMFAYAAGTTYECDVERDDEDGLLYAGYSGTHTEFLQRDASRWSVVEAQCLLEHHGVSPGVVDGSFGSNTERAVRRLQDEAGIAVDGMIGPDTWKALRT